MCSSSHIQSRSSPVTFPRHPTCPPPKRVRQSPTHRPSSLAIARTRRSSRLSPSRPHAQPTATMFDWLRGKKSAPSSSAAAQDEAASPPAIRKPQHAYRDARMSIPIAEREFYETIQARKRASVAQSLGTTSLMNGKGKARSPLAYDSGESLLISGMVL